MIYVSSACSSQKKIGDAVQELADNGFRNIELTGGTAYYDTYEQHLIRLKNKYHLNYLVHNYFPPAEEDFVLNLASLDKETYQKSMRQIKKSIDLATKLDARIYSFHAGFLIDIDTNELGRPIQKKTVADFSAAEHNFCKGFKEVKRYSRNIALYLENNVYSASNYKQFGPLNPFMLTTYDDYVQLKRHINFNLLVDIAHLYVTSKTLHFSFPSEFNKLFDSSDYFHVSDNDGCDDQNLPLDPKGELFATLKEYNLSGKTVTLEIVSGMESLKESFKRISNLIS